MPEPLPFPSQAPPKQPAQSFTPLQQFPGLGLDINHAQSQQTILGNATPFPTITGPNILKIFPILANLLSNTGAGAALATNDAIHGAGKALSWPFEDSGPEQWNPSQQQQPNLTPTLPGSDFIPQQGQTGLEGLPTLDTTQSFQGPPVPHAPGAGKLPEYNPDFTAADEALAAGRPQQHTLKQKPWDAFFTGAGKAAGQVDPRTPWATALAQMLSGGTAERQNLYQQQEELDLRNEAEQSKYQLMMAGVDEQRATAESQAKYQRAVQMESIKQQAFGNALRTWELLSPNIQANADGSLIATTRGADGKVTVQRLGFDDALRTELQIAQAKAMFGREGQVSAEMAAAQRLGPLGMFSYLSNQADQSGLLGMILAPESQSALEGKMANYQQEMGVSGLPPALITARVNAERRANLVQLILNDPNARKRLLDMMLPRAQQAQPTHPSGSNFYNPGLQ